MILIDASFVNSLGAIKILSQILCEIKTSDKGKFFLFIDSRLKNNKNISINSFKNILFIKKGILNRQIKYFSIKNKIKVIFSLGNIPLIFVSKKTYQITYNMQYFIFNQKHIPDLKLKIVWILKSYIIKLFFFISNSDVAVQTKSMKYLFQSKLSLPLNKIFEYPVFRVFKKTKFNIYSNSILCISSGEKYKQIESLLEVMKKLNEEKNIRFNLILTVNSSYKSLINKINRYIKEGYNINNLGIIDEKKVEQLLSNNYRVIHPSKIESFGLVLVEAASKGNAIISPELDYVNDICIPSLTYKINDINGMKNAIERSFRENISPSKLKIKDKTKELVNHLTNKLNGQD